MTDKAELADKIVQYVRSRGNDATDVRDAVHEAVHALDGGAEDWDRDEIHRALMDGLLGGSKERTLPVTSEVNARAMEWAVCDWLGVEYDPKHWLPISPMEALKYGIMLPPQDFEAAVRRQRRLVDPETWVTELLRGWRGTSPTGRIVGTRPNLQNIPIRTEEGRRIREALVRSKEKP